MNRPRICFSLLNYQKSTHRHYFHIYEFIEALSHRADVRLLVMDAEDPPEFEHPAAVIDLTGHGMWARWCRCREIIRSRMLGYTVFYHHYTTAPARFSSVINRLTGGRTYLWHCIVMEALDDIVKTSRVQRMMLRWTFRMVHHLVTGTEFMADYYASRYPIRRESIRVVPNYLNIHRFRRDAVDTRQLRQRLSIPDDRKIVLYLHEIEEGRAALLPAIITGVLDRRADVVFVVAGDGRYRGELETRLAAQVRDRTVLFTGRVANTDTPWFYAGADLFIMTSQFEAFSRVLLEAMAMGTPYVATDGGGNIRTYTPENHQEFILSRENWDCFPERIDCLLDDRDRIAAFIACGYDHVQAYSMDRIVELFLQTIR
ncbi:glycosyltransferase family 4 protein [bacterium]|nr:glycosyltransferase family 4 protein [candidate division CSSED10-310 bacterium]